MDTSYYVDTYYGYNAASAQGIVGGMFVMMIILCILSFAISIFMIICLWKIFEKLGKPGWASLIPFYNVYVMCEIAGKEWWYILLSLIPIVNIYAMFVLYDGIAKKFGKTTGFTIGMLFLPFVFFPILAFSKNASATNESENSNNTNLDGEQTNVNPVSDLNTNNYQSVNVNGTYNEGNIDLEKTQINIGQDYQSLNANPNLIGVQNNFQMPNAPTFGEVNNNTVNQSQNYNQFSNASNIVSNDTLINNPVNQQFNNPNNLNGNIPNNDLVNNLNQTPDLNNNNVNLTNDNVAGDIYNASTNTGYQAPSFNDNIKTVNMPNNSAESFNDIPSSNLNEQLNSTVNNVSQTPEVLENEQTPSLDQNVGYAAPSFDVPMKDIEQINLQNQTPQASSLNVETQIETQNNEPNTETLQNVNLDQDNSNVTLNEKSPEVRTSLWSNRNQNND